jgi:hypothetical protein
LTIGLGLKTQLTSVGNEAGAHASVYDSPAIPVPGPMEMGMLTLCPAVKVVAEGTFMAGTGAMVTVEVATT